MPDPEIDDELLTILGIDELSTPEKLAVRDALVGINDAQTTLVDGFAAAGSSTDRARIVWDHIIAAVAAAIIRRAGV
jgi:hypothetical protein